MDALVVDGILADRPRLARRCHVELRILYLVVGEDLRHRVCASTSQRFGVALVERCMAFDTNALRGICEVREVFETNTFGVMAMTQAVLPRLRARRSGVVVNVTSSATLAPMPLVAVYTASKTAIGGFTGSLAHELADLGIQVQEATDTETAVRDEEVRTPHRQRDPTEA